MPDNNMLTRPQVDEIVKHMTPRDLFNAMPTGEDGIKAGAEVAANVFEQAAERQGFGAGALDRLSMADGVYLAGLLGEVFQSATPKDEPPSGKPRSRDSGA